MTVETGYQTNDDKVPLPGTVYCSFTAPNSASTSTVVVSGTCLGHWMVTAEDLVGSNTRTWQGWQVIGKLG